MWDNATNNDFFTDIEPYFVLGSLTMADWIDMWVNNKSCNIIEVVWDNTSVSTKSNLSLYRSTNDKYDYSLKEHLL
jgi:hypothetical protein